MRPLTIYLFDEDITSFEEQLRDDARAAAEPIQLAAAPAHEFEYRLYRTSTESDQPGWAPYLNEHFHVDWSETMSYSAALLVQVDGRYFALTFNRGAAMLRTELVVPDFGRRVSGNGIRVGGLRGVRSQTFGARVRRTHQGLNVGGSQPDFRYDAGLELVRGIRGESEEDFATSLDGAESLRISPTDEYASFPALGRLLRRILECYRQDTFRTKFSMLEDYQRVPRGSRLDRILNRDVIVRLRTQAWDGLETAVPEPLASIAEQEGTSFRIRRDSVVDEIALGDARRAIERFGEDALHQVKVVVVDSEGATHAQRPLHDYLTAQIEREGSRFALCDGHWYLISPTQYSRVERELATIAELDLQLLELQPGEHETDYNQRLAIDRGWLNFEELHVRVGNSTGQIEVCDLLTPDMRFICVKKLRGSSTLSHLFAQGSVSAQLFQDRELLYSQAESYAAFVLRQHSARWPHLPAQRRRNTIVYAIATERTTPLATTLPYFSRVNLVNHAKQVRNCDFEVALARVPRAHASMPQMRPRGGRGGRRPRRTPVPGQQNLFD